MSRWADPFLLVQIFLVAFLAVIVTGTIADPDLWGHIQFGHDIVAAGAVPRADVYSFTSDKPWINHEWLSEVVMYATFARAGAPGLIVLKALIVLAILGIVAWSLGRFKPTRAAQGVVLAVAVVGTLWRLQTVRPQMFSLLLFAVLLLLLSEAGRGRLWTLIVVPLLMALWVNVHGGWLVGIGTLAMWLAFGVLERGQNWTVRALLCATGAASVLATLANPYGSGIWTFLRETVGVARPDIMEWFPIFKIPVGAALPWVVSSIAAAFVVLRSDRPRWGRHLAIVLALAVAAFLVNRLDAFFAVAVVIFLAPEFAQLWPGRARPTVPPASARARYAAVFVTLTAAGVIGWPAGRIALAQLRCLSIQPDLLPEPEAADFVQRNGLRGNLLTWFDWGEYALWRFGPGLKVSIDGRRETVYSNARIAAHYAFYRAEPDAQRFAQDIRADYIWLPKQFPAVQMLKRQGWYPAFEGPVSIVFARQDDAVFVNVRDHPRAPRCFPGP